MKSLLEFLIESITGSTGFEVDTRQEGRHLDLLVKADPAIVGLIIGKEGKTIKNLRRILAVRATKEDLSVHITVNGQ